MRMLIDIVRQSLATLWAHKLRSFLTMFGIAWGVGSLLLLVGLGTGGAHGRTLAHVEDAKLDAGGIDIEPHLSVEGVYFFDEMPLAKTAHGRIT